MEENEKKSQNKKNMKNMKKKKNKKIQICTIIACISASYLFLRYSGLLDKLINKFS
jgi:small neutral amino acid transporter SnatA (MarC family)